MHKQLVTTTATIAREKKLREELDRVIDILINNRKFEQLSYPIPLQVVREVEFIKV